MLKMMRLGPGIYVRPDEIIAIDEHCRTNEYSMGAGFAHNKAMPAKAAVLLRNGQLLPAWISVSTLRRNVPWKALQVLDSIANRNQETINRANWLWEKRMKGGDQS